MVLKVAGAKALKAARKTGVETMMAVGQTGVMALQTTGNIGVVALKQVSAQEHYNTFEFWGFGA